MLLPDHIFDDWVAELVKRNRNRLIARLLSLIGRDGIGCAQGVTEPLKRCARRRRSRHPPRTLRIPKA